MQERYQKMASNCAWLFEWLRQECAPRMRGFPEGPVRGPGGLPVSPAYAVISRTYGRSTTGFHRVPRMCGDFI